MQAAPIDAIVRQHELQLRLTQCIQRATSMCLKEQAGKHVRARTWESTLEDLVFECEAARDALVARPWLRPGLFRPPAERACQPALLESVHFLCLLRAKLPAPLPIELWCDVLDSVFSNESRRQLRVVRSFGYAGDQLRLALEPLPELPPDEALQLLVAALQKRTGPEDAALLVGEGPGALVGVPAREAAHRRPPEGAGHHEEPDARKGVRT